MRDFINKDGIYIVSLPLDWYHKNKLYDSGEKAPDTFEFLKDPIGAFQLSVTTTDKVRFHR